MKKFYIFLCGLYIFYQMLCLANPYEIGKTSANVDFIVLCVASFLFCTTYFTDMLFQANGDYLRNLPINSLLNYKYTYDNNGNLKNVYVCDYHSYWETWRLIHPVYSDKYIRTHSGVMEFCEKYNTREKLLNFITDCENNDQLQEEKRYYNSNYRTEAITLFTTVGFILLIVCLINLVS